MTILERGNHCVIDHTYTCPQDVVEVLQEAISFTNQTEESSVLFPFYRDVRYKKYCMYLRRNSLDYPIFNIDLGLINGNSTLDSQAFIDFWIQNMNPSKSRAVASYGSELELEHQSIRVNRPNQEMIGDNALFVHPDLRDQGIAVSLISSARYLLSLIEVRFLDFWSIVNQDGKKNWEFYQKAGARLYKKSVVELSDGKMIDCARALIPTKASDFYPYRFGDIKIPNC